MKKIVLMMAFMVIGLSQACTYVEPGHVGIIVDLYGNDKGVVGKEVGVGRYWIGMGEKLYTFPTFQQNYVWTKDNREGSENDESFTFQTKEGLEVSADIGINYEIEKDKVSIVFKKYRRGVNDITDNFLRAYVRDAFNSYASKMSVEGVYGSQKMALLKNVEDEIRKKVEVEGIKVNKIFLIGGFRLPQQVVEALNLKITATQRAQQRENEILEEQAKAKKKVAEAEGEAQATLMKAKAQAEANKILSRSITPTLVEYERVKKWNGELPQVQGGAGTFLTLPTKSNKMAVTKSK